MITLPHTPSFRLDGRRALVTGGSSGIGLAGAVALAEAGAHVVIVSRTTKAIKATAQAICDAGFIAEGRTLDVTDLTAVQQFVEAQAPFHILFNNAGSARNRTMLDTNEEDYNAVTDINVKGAYFTAQAVIKKMMSNGIKGSIIHTSSQMGHTGGIERTVYCATKHAIEGLTKAMAVEFGPYGIRVNTLAPTFIRTPLTESALQDSEKRTWIMNKIKLGRVGEPEDIMGAVLFLASDASAMITGTSLVIDGGWTAG